MTEKKSQPIEIKMRKHHSPHLIRFRTDPEDSHFINVDLVKVATGEVKCNHYIGFAEKIKLNNIATWYFCSVC